MNEDLDANRRGVLSPQQARVILSMDQWAMLAMLAVPFGAVMVIGPVVHLMVLRGGLFLAVGVVLGAALTAAAIFATFAVRGRLLQRLTSAPVQALDGFVRWNGKWVAEGHTAAGPVDLITFALPPGPYRFYVYERRIAGAESPLGPGFFSLQQMFPKRSFRDRFPYVRSTSCMTPLPVGDPQTLMAALSQALGFSAEDLDANRRGWLSPAQGQGNAVVVEGRGQVKWVLRSKLRPADCYIVIGDVEIPIPSQCAGVFVPGLTYRVYRRASDGTLLSLEPIA